VHHHSKLVSVVGGGGSFFTFFFFFLVKKVWFIFWGFSNFWKSKSHPLIVRSFKKNSESPNLGSHSLIIPDLKEQAPILG